MENDTDLRGFAELVRDMWRDPRRYEQENAFGAVVHLATFDLDYYGYLLVQTWDHLERSLGDADVRWEYSLWYCCGDPVKIADFPGSDEGDVPFVESAIAVEKHREYVADYMAEHHELP